MNPPRIYWRRAHPVRLPNRIDTLPHAQMMPAFEQDIRRYPRLLEDKLAKEIDRELEMLP
jgi:hypothetical protein